MGEACRSVAFLRMPTALMDPGWPGEAGLGSGAVGSSGEFPYCSFQFQSIFIKCVLCAERQGTKEGRVMSLFSGTMSGPSKPSTPSLSPSHRHSCSFHDITLSHYSSCGDFPPRLHLVKSFS